MDKGINNRAELLLEREVHRQRIREIDAVLAESQVSEPGLKVADHELLSVVQSAPDPLFIKNLAGRIVFVNEAFIREFGVSAQQVIGKSEPELFDNPDRVRAKIDDDRLIMQTGDKQVYELRRPAAGDERIYQISKVPWRDDGGNTIGIVGTAANVTEFKQIEQDLKKALQDMERRTQELNAIMTSIPDSLIIYDCEARPVFVNRQAEAFYRQVGMRIQDSYQKRFASTQFFDENGRPLSIDDMPNYRTLRTGMAVRDFVFMVRTIDGQTIFCTMSNAPIRNQSGEITGAVIVQRDITKQKLAEAQLRQSERQATMLVEQLQEADRNKTRFISVLSHELRNPLATIVMGHELLKRIPPDSEQAMRTRIAMERQTTILARLVDDLLDVTRISENKIKLVKKPLDLVEIVARSIADVEPLFTARGVLIEADLPSSPLCLEADGVRLMQVFGNLLQNALKFTRGGDRVQVSVVREDEGTVMVQIKDTGMGIEADVMRNLFQPFMQADRSLARTQGGLGLGLSIVKGIVDLHGGQIEAFSEGIGKGTEFTIRLPIPRDTAH